MASFREYALPTLAGLWLASPAQAQTTLTMSTWAPPAHPLTSVVLQGFADEVEKASGGRLKFQMLPKHPVAGPGTFDAVRDGLVDISIAATSWSRSGPGNANSAMGSSPGSMPPAYGC